MRARVSENESRSFLSKDIAPLVGSLGLHVACVLALMFAARHPTRTQEPMRERPDAWLGNAVEIDAIASPEVSLNSVNEASNAVNGSLGESDHTKNSETAPSSEITAAPSPPKAAEPTIVQPAIAPASKPRAAHVAKPRSVGTNDGEKSKKTTGADNASAASSAAPASGAFGGEGLPPGVRSLPSAFTRAIPPATGADPVWQTLPVGSEHPFTISLEVAADGHIASAELVKEKDGSEPAIQATHLKQRVVALLGGGLFALQNEVGEGRALFRITITLSDRAVHEDDDPAQLVERGFEPPRAGNAGRAYFTLASGRHFEAKVQVLSEK